MPLEPFVTFVCSPTFSAVSSALKLAEIPALAGPDGGFVTPLRPRRALGVVCDFVGVDHAVRIKISWVALAVVVLSVGLLLVASREGSLFSNRSAPPGTNVSAEPTAPSSATPTPSSTPPATTAAAPSATPTPLPSEQPAPTAAGPSAPAPPALAAAAPSTVPPGTSPAATAAAPAAPTPTAAAPSEQPASPPAPTAAGPSAPAPPAPPAAAPSVPPSAAPPAATAVAPQPPSVLPAEAEMSAADRRQVQEALNRLDYYKGPVDGIFGPLTHAAIRRFQQSIGSDATGYLTAGQANRLVTPR
jgi:hypothetical protein